MKKYPGINKNYDSSYTIQVTTGYRKDPTTGKVRQIRKTVSVKGTLQDAIDKKLEMEHALKHGTFVKPSKTTLREYLPKWLDLRKGDPQDGGLHFGTVETYTAKIETIGHSDIADVPLQALRRADLKAFYNTVRDERWDGVTRVKRKRPLTQRSVLGYHILLHAALKDAEADDLITVNPARKLKGKDKPKMTSSFKATILELEDIQRLLKTAEAEASPQDAAMLAVALDLGCRKAELCGLRWSNVDWKTGTIAVVEQLIPEAGPMFQPLKGGEPRKPMKMHAHTMLLLMKHREAQQKLKWDKKHYATELDLVFAMQHRTQWKPKLGLPLSPHNLGVLWLNPLLEKAGVPHIRVHDLRHCCAALMIWNGESLVAIAERLGHADPTVTARVYAHLLKGHQEGVSQRLGDVLYAGR